MGRGYHQGYRLQRDSLKIPQRYPCPAGLASIPNQYLLAWYVLPSQHTGGVRVDTEKRRGGMEDGSESITEDLNMSNLFPTADTEFKGVVQVKAENM